MQKNMAEITNPNDFIHDEILYSGILSEKLSKEQLIQESDKSKLLQNFLIRSGKFQTFCAESTD